MKKILKGSIFATLMLAIVVFAAPAFALDIDEIYPVRPGTDAWLEFDDYNDMLAVIVIPDEKLEQMTTEELIYAALNCPFMMQLLYLHDDYEFAYVDQVDQNSALAELATRPDAAEKLYSALLDDAILIVDSEGVGTKIYQNSLLMLILMQPDYTNELTSLQSDYIAKEAISMSLSEETNIPFDALRQMDGISPTATAYVYTPAGSRVTVETGRTELTYSQKVEMNTRLANEFPDARRWAEPTNTWNCHAYAWASNRNVWMKDASLYVTDGSYVRQTTGTVYSDMKVYWPTSSNGSHSGIITAGGTIGSSSIEVSSKWGNQGAYYHGINYHPYAKNSTPQYYYINR